MIVATTSVALIAAYGQLFASLASLAITALSLSYSAAYAATMYTASVHQLHPRWALPQLFLFATCALYQSQRWLMSLEIWNTSGSHSAQTRSLANHLATTRRAAWLLAALCRHPKSLSLYSYFYSHPLLAAPIIWAVIKLTQLFTTAGFHAVTKPVATAKALPRRLLTVCDPTTFTKNFNLWAKHQIDSWRSLDAYATLSQTPTKLVVLMDYTSFWWVLMYLDPWTIYLAPGLPAATHQALEYATMCSMYAVPFAYTILDASVTHFIEQTGGIALIALCFIAPGITLFFAALTNATAKRLQSAISPQCRALYWYSVFTLLASIVVMEMTQRMLSPTQCAYMNPFSWPVCLVPSLAHKAPTTDHQTAAMVLTNATKSAYLAFTKAISTISAQPPYGQEAVLWGHNNLPAALLVPGVPAIAG
jgi:hypothetical protein